MGEEKLFPTKAAVEFTPPQDEDCPFCNIVSAFPPIPPSSTPINSPQWDMHKTTDEPTLVVLSTPHVIAFFDRMPSSEGHILICPRNHHPKLGYVSREGAAEIGRVLPLLTRSVMRSVMPDIPVGDTDYNVVQNNGPGAAQAVGHVHFHIVPRPPIGYKRPQRIPLKPPSKSRYPASKFPTGLGQASTIMFNRGRREWLDFEESEPLAMYIRREIAKEWKLLEDDLEREGRWSGKL